MAKVTIDQLAVMMNRSFQDLGKDIKEIKVEFNHVNERFNNVENTLDKVEVRLDSIEGKLINNHENRITRLEDDMRLAKAKSEK